MQILHGVMHCAGRRVSPASAKNWRYWTSFTATPGLGSAPLP